MAGPFKIAIPPRPMIRETMNKAEGYFLSIIVSMIATISGVPPMIKAAKPEPTIVSAKDTPPVPHINSNKPVMAKNFR